MMIIRYFWLGGDYQISAEFLVYNNDVLWKKVNAFSFELATPWLMRLITTNLI